MDVRATRTRFLQTILLIAPLAASASCLNPSKLPVDIRDCGAHALEEPGWSDFESTSAIQDALATGNVILIPPGTWKVQTIHVHSGKTIATAGLATVLKQKAGTTTHPPGQSPPSAPIVWIDGSDVEIGSFTAIGNIGSDEGEGNHALQVASAAAISNIKIGDISGSNIRGDVLYLWASNTAQLSNVRFGTITGTNILRSIVSITGGTDITGAAVIGGNCGYTTLDIEPNRDAQAPDRITIGKVQGGKLQLAAEPNTVVIGSVDIAFLDLDTSYQSPPNPLYTRQSDGSSYFDTDIGVLASRWTQLRIGQFRAAGKRWSAFYSGPWEGAGSLEIGKYVGSGNGAGNQTPGEFNCEGCSSLRIHSGATQLYSSQKALFTGAASTVYEVENFALMGGPLGAYVTKGFFRNLTIDSSNVPYLMSSVQNSVFQNVRVTKTVGAPISTFFWSSVDNVFVDSDLAAIRLQAGSSGNNLLVRTPVAP
jgi:hypothetical protein